MVFHLAAIHSLQVIHCIQYNCRNKKELRVKRKAYSLYYLYSLMLLTAWGYIKIPQYVNVAVFFSLLNCSR